MTISHWTLLRMRNVSDKSCRVNRSTHFMFSNFFSENSAIYAITSKNVVGTDRPQITIWSIRVACWIIKVTRLRANMHTPTRPCTHTPRRTHTHACSLCLSFFLSLSLSLSLTHTHTHTHTEICNTLCFSTATMVTRRRFKSYGTRTLPILFIEVLLLQCLPLNSIVYLPSKWHSESSYTGPLSSFYLAVEVRWSWRSSCGPEVCN
jgi:hypothetical protein